MKPGYVLLPFSGDLAGDFSIDLSGLVKSKKFAVIDHPVLNGEVLPNCTVTIETTADGLKIIDLYGQTIFYDSGAGTFSSIPNGLVAPMEVVTIQGSDSDYMAYEIKDGVLYVVVEATVTNDTDASISNVSFRPSDYSMIPDSVWSRIYRIDGTTCDEAYSSENVITRFAGCGGNNVRTCVMGSYSARTLNLYINETIAAGASQHVSLRTFLIL